MDTRVIPVRQAGISVTVLGKNPEIIEAQLIEFRGKHLRLRSSRVLEPGLPVKIESGGDLILGTVLESGPCAGGIQTAIHVQHLLQDAELLGRMFRD